MMSDSRDELRNRVAAHEVEVRHPIVGISDADADAFITAQEALEQLAAASPVGASPADGDVATWDEASGRWVPAAPADTGTSASAAPLIASTHIGGSPIAGGYQATCVLIPGGGSQFNIISGCTVPWQYDAGHTFWLRVDPPAFTTGTLEIAYAEVNVASPDGTERKASALEDGLALTSATPVMPLVLDTEDETAGAGTDLDWQPLDGGIFTTAGGLYAVSFFIQFTASADLA